MRNVRSGRARFGGPAVVEVFGERSVELVSQKHALHLSKEQRQNARWNMQRQPVNCRTITFTGKSGALQLLRSRYRRLLRGQEDGKEGKDRYPEIFDAVIRINTLDYQLYQRIQQKIIDVLDPGQICDGKGNERKPYQHEGDASYPADPDRETNFENCVADVNIPVGEVFTSPVLTGTEGTLHVKPCLSGRVRV